MTGGAWLRLVENVLAAGLARGTPMLLAALGETCAERAGVLNLGIEGVMLAGAVAGVAAAHASGSVWAGFALALVAGMLLGLLHAAVTVSLRADQVVAGLALVFLGAGFASVAGAPLVGLGADLPHLEPLFRGDLGGLARLPLVGPLLFRHSAIVYLALLFAPLLWLLLHRTRPGLALRATGENPEAARAMGLPVVTIRYLAVIAGGGLAGLGGASLSLAITPGWVDGMTAGQGWIALGLVLFARWNPLAVVGGAFLFGVVRRLPLDLQGTDLAWFRDPNVGYFLNMLPYVLTIAVLVVAAGGARRSNDKPAALGKPLDG